MVILNKKQASSHTKKDEKKYIIHHIPGHKNKHLGKRKKTNVTDMIEQVGEDGSGRHLETIRKENT